LGEDNMAALNFTTDMTALWGSRTSTDATYIALPATHASSVKEQNLLVLVDAMRAYMAELATGQEARIARQMINRMTAEIMTSTGGYDTALNVTNAADRARDAALSYYLRSSHNNMVADADPVLDPDAILE
jgi:hypothetical protein